MKTLSFAFAATVALFAFETSNSDSLSACASCREGGVRSKACETENRVNGLDIKWGAANVNTFKAIQEKKQAMLLFFVDKDNPAPARTDIGDLASKGLLRGVTVPQAKQKKAKQEKKGESILPASKLQKGSDLWKAYGVKTGGVYLLTDQFGNEVGRANSPKIRESALGAAKVIKERRELVAKKSEAAKKALKNKDFAKAYEHLSAASKEHLVGYEESTTLAKVYQDWLSKGEAAIVAAKDNAKELKKLRSALGETPLASKFPAKVEAKKDASDDSKETLASKTGSDSNGG